MELLNSYNKTMPQREGCFQVGQPFRKSESMDFFENIYSFPPKMKLRWSVLDEFNSDLLLDYNYNVLRHSLPFVDLIDGFTFSPIDSKEVNTSKFRLANYLDGYKEKQYSSKFYTKGTKSIQKALSTIPVYVVLNGRGEIALAKPQDSLIPDWTDIKHLGKYFDKLSHSFCGDFQTKRDRGQSLGLFFMSPVDAQKYIEDIGTGDGVGNELVGLSVHCIGLDSAYTVMREHHPDTDFRFIPDVKEVKTLLLNQLGKPDILVDDAQQQVRFRVRSVNPLPRLPLGTTPRLLSPLFSVLQRNEYFKGVPIYVVQLRKSPLPVAQDLYYKGVNTMDSLYGRFIQFTDFIDGFGHNWGMQGALEDTMTNEKCSNYIFFSRTQAAEFAKNAGRKTARLRGSRTSNMQGIVKNREYSFQISKILLSYGKSR